MVWLHVIQCHNSKESIIDLIDLLSSVQNPVQADALINKQSTKVSISGTILGF